MSDGFEINELDEYIKNVMANVNDSLPKEAKKFIKKEAVALNKINKRVYKSKGIGLEPTNTPQNKKIINRFKSGKAYKFNGVWSARALNSAPHAHLINDGFIHKPHKGEKGGEKWVEGFHFMEDAQEEFESKYGEDCENFVNKLTEKM